MSWIPEQIKVLFRNLFDTWPRSELTLSDKREWGKALKEYPYELVMRAITAHRRQQIEVAERCRREAAWAPVLRDLLEQCQMLAGLAYGNAKDQLDYQRRVYAMSRIERANHEVSRLNQLVSADQFDTPPERDSARYALAWWQHRQAAEAALSAKQEAYREALESRGCEACELKTITRRDGRVCRGCVYRQGAEP